METLWCFDARGGCYWSEVAPDNEVVLSGSGGAYGIVAFNREGKTLWFDSPVSLVRAFLMSGKCIFVDNKVYSLTGELVYEIKELSRNVDFVYAANNSSRIIAVDSDGTLYILEGAFKRRADHTYNDTYAETVASSLRT